MMSNKVGLKLHLAFYESNIIVQFICNCKVDLSADFPSCRSHLYCCCL